MPALLLSVISQGTASGQFLRPAASRLARAVEGSLVSTTYERGNGKDKKAKTNEQTF